MKNRLKFSYIAVTILSIVIFLVLLLNIFLMYRLTSKQTDEMGQMKIDLIASELQQRLTDASHSVDTIGASLEELFSEMDSEGYSGDRTQEIYNFLSAEKKSTIASSGRACLNIFCITRSDEVLISDMATPEDYVVQDRIWYKGLMSVPTGDTYISSIYKDAFTEDMCFTVSKVLGDGESILGIDYSMSEIQAYIEKMNASDYGEAMIINRDGVIVGFSDTKMIGQRLSADLNNYYTAFMKANSQDLDSISIKTANSGTVFCSKTENDWYLMLSIGNWELYKDSYMQLIISSATLILMILVITLFLIIVMRERYNAENALRSREEFLSGLSDKFRIPLHNILELTAPGSMNNAEQKNNAENIRTYAFQLSDMMDNLFSYSRIVSTNRVKKAKGRALHMSVKTQHKFRLWIILVFIVTMLFTIFISSSLHLRWARTKMTEEANSYRYQISSWVLEQKNILEMFTNTISAEPEKLDDYNGMVAWLDDITKHYSGISATYIANPQFNNTHGHPMIMNNGWVPADDYVEEERQWYIDALATHDYSISEPYYDARTGQYCITFSKAVYADSGKFLGVFAIDFYLNVLTDIIDSNYTENGYAFLADKDGQIINHPNTAYQPWDGKFVNISTLTYDRIYSNADKNIGLINDYDNKLRECLIIKDTVSNFNIIVVKDIWSMYGDVLRYIIIYTGLFSICIIGVITLINKMILLQKEANDTLRHAAEVATSADRAKSLFLAQMSHEIRTPINAVLGMNEMILRENHNPEIKEYSMNIKSAGNTLLSLINDILDFSKIESGKMEITPVKYDTASMINDLVNMTSDRAAKKNLEFKIEVDEKIPAALYGDDIRIRQIIINLLTNAVKYTEQGTVSLKFSITEKGDDYIILYVEVSDTGIGIKDEDMQKLFDSFQRLDEHRNRSIEGTGLGIPITHNLLKMMGSNLNVSSVYGKGSVFSFELKQGISDPEQIGDFSSRRLQSLDSEQNSRYIYAPDADILIVDDNAMNLKVASNLMKRNGFIPDTASSGQKCIEMVLAKHYDIIFMDHMMPDMDGIETFNNLKDSHILPDDTAVIAMTANAVAGAKETYLQHGFCAYLSKPIVIRQLEAVLEKYIPQEKVSYKNENAEDTSDVTTEEPVSETPVSNQTFEEKFSFLDVKTGLSYCADDTDIYTEIIATYFENSKLGEINNFFEAEDWENYRILVHSLKSTSLSIGATNLSEQAKALEFAARDNNIVYIKENHEKCMTDYENLLNNIKSALGLDSDL